MGANASSLRPHDAGYVEDERVLLEIVKQKGEEAGLGLMIGEKGVLEVVYCEENSPFFGLIEPGDILYEVNGVQYSGAEAREAAQHIRNTTGLALLGTFRKPPPPPVRLPSEPEAGLATTQSASTTEVAATPRPRRPSLRRKRSAAARIFVALKRTVRRRQRLVEASHHARPIPTIEQRDEIAQEAEVEVQKLDLQFVKLCVADRRIESQMINFNSSNPAEFLDSEAAHRICDDVAKVMHMINDILDAKGLRRFGLSVEGHTSAPTNAKEKEEKAARVPIHLRGTAATASKEKEKIEYTPKPKADPHGLIALSTKRACAVARRIEKTYKTLASKGSTATGSTLTAQAMGHGAMRPLPGYNDGKNHPENRRVEFRLLIGDEAEMRPKSFDKGTRGKSTRVLVGIDDHDEDVVAPMRPQRLSMSRSPQTGGNRARGARASTKVAPAAKTD